MAFGFLRIITGEVASGLPELKLPPMQTTIGDQTLYFTDMITHVGSSILALPLISILESIAVAKAFCKYFSFFEWTLNLKWTEISSIFLSSSSNSQRANNWFDPRDVSIGNVQFIWIIFSIDASYRFIYTNGCQQCQRCSYNARWYCHRLPCFVVAGIFDQLISLHTKNYISRRHHLCHDRLSGQRGYQGNLAIKAYVSNRIQCHSTKKPKLIDFINYLFAASLGIDIIPFICTLVACLAYSIEFGILIGIAVNLTFVMYNIARPNIHVYNRKVSTMTCTCQSLFNWPLFSTDISFHFLFK